jgi:hypothetical protein
VDFHFPISRPTTLNNHNHMPLHNHNHMPLHYHNYMPLHNHVPSINMLQVTHSCIQ